MANLQISINGIVSKSQMKVPRRFISETTASMARKHGDTLFFDGAKLGYKQGVGYIAYVYSFESYKRIAAAIVGKIVTELQTGYTITF